MRNATDITMILDRSGSMSDCKVSMEEALNGFITDQKTVKGECKFSLVKFDTEYELSLSSSDIRNVGKITIEPRGGTALLDAIGRTIDQTGQRLANMQEHERPEKVLIVIVTDGEENQSREYIAPPTQVQKVAARDWNTYRSNLVLTPGYNPSQRVFDMITHQRDVYKWEFMFLGANQDAIATASKLGIPIGSTMSFDTSDGGYGTRGSKHISKAISTATSAYRGVGGSSALAGTINKMSTQPDTVDEEYTKTFSGTGALEDQEDKKCKTTNQTPSKK